MDRGDRSDDVAQRRKLLIVLLLNAALVVGLAIGGIMADSSALMANALDNTSDVIVYAVSYYAARRSERWKRGAATFAGIMLLLVALAAVADVIRRFVQGAQPEGPIIIPTAIAAGVINAICLKILSGTSGSEIHMRVAWKFSINDFFSNFGAVVAGVLVLALDQRWPDLVIGLMVMAVVIYGGVGIIRDARRSSAA